jgi:hypothetical protein
MLSNNYDRELSLTGERGITNSATKKRSSQEDHMEEHGRKRARLFLREWIFTGTGGQCVR